MSLNKLQNILNRTGYDNVVMPRQSFVTLIELLRDSVADQGPIALKLLSRLLEQLSEDIEIANKAEPVDASKLQPVLPPVPEKKYILSITGLAVPKERIKIISLIKDLRRVLDLGLKEAKDWAAEIANGAIKQYMWSLNIDTIRLHVQNLRDYGYHIQVTFADDVIYDSQDPNNDDLMNLVPIPF